MHLGDHGSTSDFISMNASEERQSNLSATGTTTKDIEQESIRKEPKVIMGDRVDETSQQTQQNFIGLLDRQSLIANAAVQLIESLKVTSSTLPFTMASDISAPPTEISQAIEPVAMSIEAPQTPDSLVKTVCEVEARAAAEELHEPDDKEPETSPVVPAPDKDTSTGVCKKTQEQYVKIPGKNAYQCTQCAKVLSSRHLAIHSISHKNEKEFSCKGCSKKYKKMCHLRNHERIHFQFKCDTCTKKYQTQDALTSHDCVSPAPAKQEESPLIDVKCNICSKKFDNDDALKIHLETHVQKDNFNCVTCGKCFSYDWSLKIHERSHEKDKPKPYKCETCGKTFKYEQTFNNHGKRCNGPGKPLILIKEPISKRKSTGKIKKEK